MELRKLEYFVEIAREGNMTRASQNLHVSQSTLSKQMKALEDELGERLFIRTSLGLSLTDQGMLLRKRAEDILNMVNKTTAEFKEWNDIVGGDIYFGCAESYLIKHFAHIIKNLKVQYPGTIFHITSGDSELVLDRLEEGLLDFAVIVETPDLSRYNYIELPNTDTWGLVIRKDHPLAKKEYITIEDMHGLDIICSPQALKVDIPRWAKEDIDDIHLVGTSNLTFNGSIFVRENLGCLLTFKYIADTSERSELVFRPLYPKLETKMYVVWKKYQIFSPIAKKLLEQMKKELS